ncbi:hypothetical protein NKH77_46375 [Streptomyces sp. M19]
MWFAAKDTCLTSMAGGVRRPMTRQFTRTPAAPGAAVVMPVLSTATAEELPPPGAVPAPHLPPAHVHQAAWSQGTLEAPGPYHHMPGPAVPCAQRCRDARCARLVHARATGSCPIVACKRRV